MKIENLTLVIVFLFVFSSLAVTKVKAQPAGNGLLFTVNHNGDSPDANHGNGVCADASGQCTLRAAIQEANANPGDDIIIFALSLPSVIDLTLGELPITTNIGIVGPSARKLTIQRGSTKGVPDFRIFNISENAGTNIHIRGLAIKNGRVLSSFSGGGINIERGNTINLTDVAVSNNFASGGGGGISNAGTLNITRSLFNSNTSGSQGGAIINLATSTARITNSTITDNSAITAGAIYNNGNLLLVNNTIVGNAASNGANSIFNHSDGTVTVLNTILGSDHASTANSLAGNFTSLGNNIVTDTRGSSGFTNEVNNDQVSDNHQINPLLGNLTDNGGQTDTRALQNGSPAIDKGNNCVLNLSCSIMPPISLGSDQRINHSRRAGIAVDIGSFEAGTGTIAGSAVFGLRIFSPPGRLAGAFAILTNAGTGEKFYSSINPFGSFSFRNLSVGGVYVLEIKSKRVGFFPPQIFAFDRLPGIPFRAEITSENAIIPEEK